MREIAALRSKLREINIEYSRFLRKGGAEERLARMGELRAERRGLMARIAQANALAPAIATAHSQSLRSIRSNAAPPTASEHLRQRLSLSEKQVAR